MLKRMYVSTKRIDLGTVAIDMDLYFGPTFRITVALDRTYPVCVVVPEREAIVLDPLVSTQLRSQSGMDCFEPSDAGDGDSRLAGVHEVARSMYQL